MIILHKIIKVKFSDALQFWEMRKELINKLNKKDKEELLSRIKKEKINHIRALGFLCGYIV